MTAFHDDMRTSIALDDGPFRLTMELLETEGRYPSSRYAVEFRVSGRFGASTTRIDLWFSHADLSRFLLALHRIASPYADDGCIGTARLADMSDEWSLRLSRAGDVCAFAVRYARAWGRETFELNHAKAVGVAFLREVEDRFRRD